MMGVSSVSSSRWIIYITLLLLLALPAAARVQMTGATITAKQDGTLEAPLNHLQGKPLVFEIGKQGTPWRRVNDVIVSGSSARWTARKDRAYELTSAYAYAADTLSEVRRAFGHQDTMIRDLKADVVGALKWVQKRATTDQRYAEAEFRLSGALSALLGITIDVSVGVEQKVWPEHNLPLESQFQCSVSGLRARFASFTKPENWRVVSSPRSTWFTSVPGEPQPTRAEIRLPARVTFYMGEYPVIAWYDVEYAGVEFKASNAVEAQVVHPIDKQGSIKTVSETQIDLNIHLTSLLTIKDVRTELYLPDGWTGTIPQERFDLSGSRDITYRITRPADETPGLRIVGAIFRIGDYATSKRLITDHTLTLGDSTAVTGLKMVQMPGTESETATVQGRKCRKLPASGGMSFDVSENFFPGEATYVTVECAGDHPSEVAVEYRTVDGAAKVTAAQPVDPGAGWQTRVFVLNGAKFDGSLEGGADFRLASTAGACGVSSIRISRFRALDH